MKRDVRKIQIWLILLFSLLCTGIVSIEAIFYKYRSDNMKEQVYNELSAVADSKQDRIRIWCKNRVELFLNALKPKAQL